MVGIIIFQIIIHSKALVWDMLLTTESFLLLQSTLSDWYYPIRGHFIIIRHLVFLHIIRFLLQYLYLIFSDQWRRRTTTMGQRGHLIFVHLAFEKYNQPDAPTFFKLLPTRYCQYIPANNVREPLSLLSSFFASLFLGLFLFLFCFSASSFLCFFLFRFSFLILFFICYFLSLFLSLSVPSFLCFFFSLFGSVLFLLGSFSTRFFLCSLLFRFLLSILLLFSVFLFLCSFLFNFRVSAFLSVSYCIFFIISLFIYFVPFPISSYFC